MSSAAISTLKLGEHLYGFYAGRPEGGPPAEASWVDDGALSLGICSYALIDGSHALVIDTGISTGFGRTIRRTLEQAGATRITVLLSHWHLDHVAGNAAFSDCEILSSARTAELLESHRAAIEAGELEGPPPIRPLVLPTRTFSGQGSRLQVGGLAVDLHRFDIHSDDATVVHVPALEALLAGDTVEDTITYVTEPDRLTTHLAELERLHELGAARVYPSHGSPETITAGGYGDGLILATRDYLLRLQAARDDRSLRSLTLQEFVQPELERGWIGYFAPYQRVHEENLELVAPDPAGAI